MKEEIKQIEQTNEKHECVYNQLIIENLTNFHHGDIEKPIDVVSVKIDCSCEESYPFPLVSFYDNPVLSASDNFKGWFTSVVDYFIQKDYRIIDKRK